MMAFITLLLFYGYLINKLLQQDENKVEDTSLYSLWIVALVLLSYLFPFLVLYAAGMMYLGKMMKPKKKKKASTAIRKWNSHSFELFAAHCERQLLYWQKGTQPNTYVAEWDGWTANVEVVNDLHILHVMHDNRLVTSVHYYANSRVFGKIHHQEEVVVHLRKNLGDGRAEKALAQIVGMMAEENWTEQLNNTCDEVKMMKETDQLITEWKCEEIANEYKRFTYFYIENVQYELHMNQEEKKAWKQSLHLLLRMHKQEKEKLSLRDMRLFVQSLADGMEKLHQRLARTYKKVKKETRDVKADH